MLGGVSDSQRAASAEDSGDYPEPRNAGGQASPADPGTAAVPAFGCQNAIALLVELRHRKRLAPCQITTCLQPGQPPSADWHQEIVLAEPPEARRHTTS
jgi:hypothetical protein